MLPMVHGTGFKGNHIMPIADLVRYSLWAAILETAYENRRQYHMFTTWLPHLLTNTFTLLLPDLMRVTLPNAHDDTLDKLPEPLDDAALTLTAMIRDNEAYVVYVAPLALGYILSHPRFNIYRGRMGAIRLAGFGLDALPHSATALAFSALVCDTVDTATKKLDNDSPLRPLSEQGSRHPALVSGVLLSLATLIWEFGEYLMYRHEMAQRGDREKINMVWSVDDTVRDAVSNMAGWAVASLVRRKG